MSVHGATFELETPMKPLSRVGCLVIGATLWCVPAIAQDWLVSPAPSIPLHVPLQPPSATAPAPAAPGLPAPVVPAVAVPHYPDAIQRLLDPYGLSNRP